MKKVLKWTLIFCAVLLGILVVFVTMYLSKQWNRMDFFEKTTVDGFDVSGKTVEEVMPILTDAFTKSHVHVSESGREQANWSLADLGYTIDEAALQKGLEEAQARQKSSVPVLISSLMNGNKFEVNVPFTSNAEKLASVVQVANFAEPRVINQNAELKFRKKKNVYQIKPEVQGTELNDADVQHLVQQAVDAAIGGITPQSDIAVPIPAELYLVPQILSTNEELNLRMNTYNSYVNAVITHVYGPQKETIDWNTIQNWIVFENGQGYLSEEKLREYVMVMGQKYNTIYYPRNFSTSVGSVITFPEQDNAYGYLIDEEGEYAQLLADIQSNTTVEREPVYIYSGIGRDGADDLAGTYVEVNLTLQHLWFYKDHELLLSTDIVSGCVAKKQETVTGVYPIAYKESPATLIPSNETNGTAVQYWMPFADGQGLHDATWRAAFGGAIYQTSGSHGCVNMPYGAAEIIFNNAPTGTAVLLYK